MIVIRVRVWCSSPVRIVPTGAAAEPEGVVVDRRRRAAAAAASRGVRGREVVVVGHGLTIDSDARKEAARWSRRVGRIVSQPERFGENRLSWVVPHGGGQQNRKTARGKIGVSWVSWVVRQNFYTLTLHPYTCYNPARTCDRYGDYPGHPGHCRNSRRRHAVLLSWVVSSHPGHPRTRCRRSNTNRN